MQAETELFLNRLERLQAKLLVTQGELLKKISLSKAQLSNIRNERHPLSVKVLRRLAAAEAEAGERQYLNEAPIKTAVHLANAAAGSQSDRQKVFEEYLAFLQSVRAAAEAFAPHDPAEARLRFDAALATWLVSQDGDQKGKTNLAEIFARGQAKERKDPKQA